MRPTSAAQQLASAGPDLVQPSWSALSTTAAAGGGDSAEPPPRRSLSLARQPTPLLPCGLTAEELAALTASQAAANGGTTGAGACGLHMPARPPPWVFCLPSCAAEALRSKPHPALTHTRPPALAAADAEASCEQSSASRRSFERVSGGSRQAAVTAEAQQALRAVWAWVGAGHRLLAACASPPSTTPAARAPRI